MALPSLRALIQSQHEIVLVVSQPDRERGRGRKRSPAPVAEAALAASIPLLRPENLADAGALESIAAARADLGIVVAFGQFIPRAVRELPRCGYLINAHASLLPRYRGAAPIARAILKGEESTGVSIMRVEREMDAGPVALSRSLAIGPEENCAELTERLGHLAADTLLEALAMIRSEEIEWTEQDADRVSLAAKLDGEERRLDWAQNTRCLIRRIHALAPRPGATTGIPGAKEGRETLRILRARPGEVPSELATPGTLRLATTREEPAMRIATGDGWLVALEVQRAGGKPMEAAAFLRGRPLAEGTLLGNLDDEGRNDG
jgi:methionyl-tRNA formyltransferase